jgi:hypothetical protein
MIRSRSFAAADFFLHPSGVVRLNPKLAKYVAGNVRAEQEEIERVAGSVLEALKKSVLQSYSAGQKH